MTPEVLNVLVDPVVVLPHVDPALVGHVLDNPGKAVFEKHDHEMTVVFTDLQPGEYIALCFIPEGSKDENTEGQGPPHFTKGMRMEFSVA